MKNKLSIAFVAACLSTAVYADDMGNSSGTVGSGTATSPETFNRLDVNNDGNLSKAELDSEPALKEEWASIDSNNDGQLDRSEFSMFEANENPSIGTDPAAQPNTGVGSPGYN